MTGEHPADQSFTGKYRHILGRVLVESIHMQWVLESHNSDLVQFYVIKFISSNNLVFYVSDYQIHNRCKAPIIIIPSWYTLQS